MGLSGPVSPGSIGLRAGETLILPVVEANALLAQTPAQIDFLVIHDGGEIEQARYRDLSARIRWPESSRTEALRDSARRSRSKRTRAVFS